MATNTITEIMYGDTGIRVVLSPNEELQSVCLNDICTILKREIMITNGKAVRMCPSAFQLNVAGKDLWFVKPFDMIHLLSAVRKEGKFVAPVCDELESWLSKQQIRVDGRGQGGKSKLESGSVSRNSLEMLYQGRPVSMKIMDNALYVNATEMGRLFNVLPSVWLRRMETVKLREEFVERKYYPDVDCQVIATQGRYGATWLEERLGIEFARWLSGEAPEFFDWYMDCLRVLHPEKYGQSPIRHKEKHPPGRKLELPDDLAEAHTCIRMLHEELEACRHKIDFFDYYVENREHFKSTRIADELEVSPYRLHQFLMEQGIITYEKKQWIVKPQYNALQCETPYLWTNPQGTTYAFGKIRRWTQAGREYIIDLWKRENHRP